MSSGNTIWYERTGDGPTIFHIHGSAFGHRNFERLTPHLVGRMEVVDFDLPGFGASSTAPHGGGIDNWADDVAELIELLGDAPAHVHGTSLGGMIGLSLAARHPEVIDRLVLSCFLCRYDTAARFTRSTWIAAARHIGMPAVADLTAVSGFSRSFFERPDAAPELESMREAFAQSDPSTFVRATESLMNLDLSPYVGAIRSPLLLLAGEQDNMTPLAPTESGYGMQNVAREVPGAELIVLPDCGHYLVIEQPEAAAEHVVAFCTRDEAALGLPPQQANV
jgi:pimeloyl-ACP methyl ester carboxylesterase